MLTKHLIVELHGCETDRTADEKYVEKIMTEAAVQAKAEVIESHFIKSGDSVLGVLFFKEGFYDVETYPNGYVGLDLRSNAEPVDNKKILTFLLKKFGATEYSASEIKRGNKTGV
jgi:S-adenosylmethionine decarboxylase